MRYFENETTVVVGSTEMRDFLSDLKRLRALVNDEVLHVYIDQLTVAIEAPPGTGSKHIAVRTVRYFERRS